MAAVDKSLGGLGEPATHAEAVTPSDTLELDEMSAPFTSEGLGTWPS